MTLNKVMLIGNVGKDPELRHLENGIMFVTITVATSERFKDRNGDLKEQTEWHNVVCWRNLAEIVEKYVHKGTQVYIEGKLRNRSWEDQNGQKRYITEVVADTLRLLGRKADSPGGVPASPQGITSGAASGFASKPTFIDPLEGERTPLDDLPF